MTGRPKRLALVSMDVALPGERGLGRSYYLAELFSRSGYEVELITGDFQHWEKRFRTPEEMSRAGGGPRAEGGPCVEGAPRAEGAPRKEGALRVRFVRRTAYRKNIELRRVLSCRVLAGNVGRCLAAGDYDLIYCMIPDNRLAAAAARCARKKGVPFVVDVEDLWPEAMRMVFDVPVLSDLLLSCFSRDARRAYRQADGVVGSSDGYRDAPLRYGIEPPRRLTVYVGCELSRFDDGARENLPLVEKPAGEFWVAYAGTLGTSYDLEALVRAADILARRGERTVRVLLMGDGPLRGKLEALAASLCGRVDFLGYMPYPVMAAYLTCADALVNAVAKKAAQSFVSKLGDYLAAGRPMISTCSDPELRGKVEADGFGLNVPPEMPEALADAIARLKSDPALCREMGRRARAVAEAEFDREKTYRKIITLTDELLEGT